MSFRIRIVPALLLLAAVGLSGCGEAAPTAPPTPMTPVAIPQRDLLLRAGPGSDYRPVGLAQPATPLPILLLSEDGDWALVSRPDAEDAWLALSPLVNVSGPLHSAPNFTITPSRPEPAVAIPQRELPLYAGPGTHYGVIGTAEPRTPRPIYAISHDGDWALVSPPGGAVGEWLGLSPFVEVSGDLSQVGAWGATPAPPYPAGARLPTAIAPRSGPGADYPVMTNLSLPYEEPLPIVGISVDGRWYAVQLPDGREAWLPATTVIEVTGDVGALPVIDQPAASPVPPVARLRVGIMARSGPGTDFAFAGSLAAGEELTIYGTSMDGGWYYVGLPEGGQGWIPASSVIELRAASGFSQLSGVPWPTVTLRPTHTPTPTLTPAPSATPTASPSPLPSITPMPTLDLDGLAATVESAVIETLTAGPQASPTAE